MKRPEELRLLKALQEATVQLETGNLAEASRLFKIVLRKAPAHFEALHFLGIAEAQRGRFSAAERILQKAVAASPGSAQARANLGNVQRELGALEPALASYDHALKIDRGDAIAHNGRGATLQTLGRLREALASFDEAVRLAPQFAGAWRNRGIASLALGEPKEALASFERALAVEPRSATLHVERGNALVADGRATDALASFDRALALDSKLVDAYYNRGVAFIGLRQFDRALTDFDQALALAPNFAPALANRGSVLVQLRRIEEAVASFDAVLALDPGSLLALSEKGYAAIAANRYDVAAEAFERLVARAPEFPYAVGNLLHARLFGCDWRDFHALKSRVGEGIQAGRPTMQPGQLLAVSERPDEQFDAARLWAAEIAATPLPPRRRAHAHAHDRLRIGYVAGDFREHAVAHLAAGLFDLHDRSRFEIFAFSFGPDDGSAMRTRLMRSIDHFIDVAAKSDRDIADLMREHEIDIAIDLTGYTQAGRPGLLTLRPADIQVSFLGYPGTLGLDCVDYIVADRSVIPETERRWYSERVVYLPDTYQANDLSPPIASPGPTRADAGLPQDGFVFCCFNANYKITPDTFDIWMRLLASVEGSVLWMLRPNQTALQNLRAAASERGIAPERLVFAQPMPHAAHLARHALAGLFLDTLPYNAHTTASDALRLGLPVLTCRGSAFPGRVAASLLQAVGLPELITDTPADYEAAALNLARDPAALAALKSKLRENVTTYPLFDTVRFCRHLESALVTMWERHRRALPPSEFAVEPLPYQFAMETDGAPGDRLPEGVAVDQMIAAAQ